MSNADKEREEAKKAALPRHPVSSAQIKQVVPIMEMLYSRVSVASYQGKLTHYQAETYRESVKDVMQLLKEWREELEKENL